MATARRRTSAKSTGTKAPARAARPAAKSAAASPPAAGRRAAGARSGAETGAGTGTDSAREDRARETAPPALIRRKEFVERVAASTGLKRGVVRAALDGILDEMGKALVAGEGLNLPPLGKITVNRARKVKGRDVLVCKLRRKMAGKTIEQALEPAGK